MTHLSTNRIQRNFRIRYDTAGLNVDSWDWTKNENAIIPVDTVFRIRLEFEETNGTGGTIGGALQVSYNGGSYADIAGTYVSGSASSQFSDNDVTINLISGAYNPFTAGYGTTDAVPSNVTINGQQTENEYCLTIVGSGVNNGDTLDFRQSGIEAYDQTPRITVSKAAAGTMSYVSWIG